MGRFLSGFLLPMLLLSAALLNWSLISMVDLLGFIFIQYAAPKIGMRSRRRLLISWYTLLFSSVAVVSLAIFHIVWAIKGNQWSTADAQWAKLIGFLSVHSQRLPYVIYFTTVQVLVVVIVVVEIYGTRCSPDLSQDSFVGHGYSFILRIGSHLRVLCCLLLPFVQLIVGISHPSWASFPFFIFSSIGLVNWSLTSNFLGLFRWWSYLLFYAGLNIVLLYIYQLPIQFPWMASVGDFIGLYKVSSHSEWSEICSGYSLLLFYTMLSWIRCDLAEMDFIMSGRDNSLTVQLLTPKHAFLIRQFRSGVRHTNFLLTGAVFRTFCVNFFTYGFPISLLALSFWSFHFASLCAFALLAYVGYVLYAIPSVFQLHRLNGLLLVFILLWAASTYVFNLTFLVLNKHMDMDIWETIGLWHYPIPGFYLFAQFCLGILVALGNLVNNSVFQYLSDLGVQYSKQDADVEDRDETKVLTIATVAWLLRKTSRAIVLILIFLIALRPGLIHAIYMIFFMIYLLSHTISRKMRQLLILLCEAHFALTYFLQLNLISNALKQKDTLATDLLRELGFLSNSDSRDFLKIAALACFCALHNHGFEVLSAFSAIVQHTPCPPIGFSILRAGLVKSILLYVYTSRSKQSSDNNSSHEKMIASYLTAIGQNFRSLYRSCGTYIALLTILIAVYRVKPNHTSFGYLFFLMVWMVSRQLLGKTTRKMWLPLKVYAIFVFILLYTLSVFFSFRKWLSQRVDLSSVFGYDPKASMVENIWESLAVLVVMQLYSYERRQINKQETSRQPSFSLVQRLLIWHGEKILNLSLFYASLSPISGFGFLYLVGMVACSTLPKSSWLPSKLFLAYSGFVLMVEYLFQLWGQQVNMFPGQSNYPLSLFLGLQVYMPCFTSLESGMRGKVLVIVSCLLRYNVFHWLRKYPCKFGKMGKWDESCPLLYSSEEYYKTRSSPVSRDNGLSKSLLEKQNEVGIQSWASFIIGLSDAENEGSNINGEDFNNISGSSKERHKWTRKQIHMLRHERLRMQIRTLKVYLKFWVENIFNLFGLEINMIALLIASFAVLNTISLLYVASLAAFILLPCHLTRKLWPVFVFLFGSVITLEYLAIWFFRFGEQFNPGISRKVPCNDCWESSDLFFDHCKKCWSGMFLLMLSK
ncbi:unnamed protein product [Linum tenue]|uniref:Piezo-type mechanosensitive ion channel homolog domain-containing protein n=1 Tax=Linum tenue TaxID=586396 RepID=A0AAV0R1C0_9ROSI|nr:unnamed protein product [Linum tenue]